MNILELQRQIKTFLSTKATRVYFRKAPENATYPYVTFDLPQSIENFSNREDFVLEIDVWDNTNLTTTIDTLVGEIDGNGAVISSTGLHRKLIFVDDLSAKIYRESRLAIEDENENIEHRQLRYNVQCYLLP